MTGLPGLTLKAPWGLSGRMTKAPRKKKEAEDATPTPPRESRFRRFRRWVRRCFAALGGFYLLQIPLEGGAEITNGRDTYLSTPDRAAILNPHLPTRMTWEEGTRQVLVQISRRAMQDHLAALLGGPSDRPLTFDGPLDLSFGPGAALRRLGRISPLR